MIYSGAGVMVGILYNISASDFLILSIQVGNPLATRKNFDQYCFFEIVLWYFCSPPSASLGPQICSLVLTRLAPEMYPFLIERQ